jgi:hypothetical protein
LLHSEGQRRNTVALRGIRGGARREQPPHLRDILIADNVVNRSGAVWIVAEKRRYAE